MTDQIRLSRLAADTSTAAVPADYEERVYAGVIGKVAAVYLGRPFEGWRYDRIMAELGEITYYVNDRQDVALKNHLLVVTDDDISGTFVFSRALRDLVARPMDELTAIDVGNTWLNYIVPDRSVLWWGGLGNSTEHTAYLRMKAGIAPPESGSMARNGKVVAEQVGAQIFVEGFAMTCPGDPQTAADLAEIAASVSHDGEALQAARVIAALVAQAFVEPEMDVLLDTATELIRGDSLIYRVINEVRQWSTEGDWHRTRSLIEKRYGYDLYGGNCHVIPNHALVISALAHSAGDFSTAMTVINTCGWDTDSNAGNVGAITGVRGGLAGLSNGPDWRGPIADRMYLPTADGGATITDAVRESVTLAAMGRARHGLKASVPKEGARFHFSFPGSVQGFTVLDPVEGTEARHVVDGSGAGVLAIAHPGGQQVVAATPTFVPPEARDMPIYGMVASPTLYPGQVIRARVKVPAESPPATIALVVRAYGAGDRILQVEGPTRHLASGEFAELSWPVPDQGGQPIVYVGLAVNGQQAGTVHLDSLTWDGAPTTSLGRPAEGGSMWRRAWVDAVDRFDEKWPESFRIVQNSGTGLLVQGAREWCDYTVSADITPHLAEAVGLAARVQGLQRYYLLELSGRDTVQLIRRRDDVQVLASVRFPWEFGNTYALTLELVGAHLRGWVDGRLFFDLEDTDNSLTCGAIALVVREGRTATQTVRIEARQPARPQPEGNQARNSAVERTQT